jgi:glutathione synthase/RimK-type ligase-like ATP-grasp enzyme
MRNRFFTRPLTVGVVVEPRYLEQRQPAGLCAELQRRGHEAVVIDPDDVCRVGSGDWLAGIDVIVPRGRSLTLLGLVELAERRGVPVVNGRSAIASVHNKLDMAVALVAAGIPTPPTFAASLERLAGAVPAGAYPLVLKPTFGDNGRGLMIAPDAEQLAHVHWPEPFALAQQLVPSDGFDLKLYGIGDDVWAVRRPSPLKSLAAGTSRPAPVELTPDLVALARRCGRLFGLELYGVDCLETSDGPLVIEVNEFPNYTGVDEADERLVAHVARCAGR